MVYLTFFKLFSGLALVNLSCFHAAFSVILALSQAVLSYFAAAFRMAYILMEIRRKIGIHVKHDIWNWKNLP
jgi:hypothetical protein